MSFQSSRFLFLGVVAVLSFFIAGCNEVLIQVEAPTNGYTVGRIIEFPDQSKLQMRVQFPSDVKSGEKVNLHLRRENRDSRFVYQVTSDTASEFFVSSLRSDLDQSVAIDLERANDRLPKYRSPVANAAPSDLKHIPVGRIALRADAKENPNSDEPDATCSGFVISKSLVVTNWHCISNQYYCNAATFYLSDDPKEKLSDNFKNATPYTCKRVLFSDYRSDQVLLWMNADFEQKGRLTLEPSLYEYPKKTPVTLIVQSLSSGKIRQNCEIVHGERGALISVGRSDAPDFTVSSTYKMSCSSKPGDSGSPVFNNEGKVIGILSGSQGENFSYMVPLHEKIRSLAEAFK